MSTFRALDFREIRCARRADLLIFRRLVRAGPPSRLALRMKLDSVLIALCLALLKVQNGRTAQGQAGTTGHRAARRRKNARDARAPLVLAPKY